MYLLQHRIKLVIRASLQDIKSLSTRSLSPLNDALKLSTMFKTPLHWALKSSTQGPLALFMRHQNPLHEFLNPLYKVHRPSVWPNAPPYIVPHPSGCAPPPPPLFFDKTLPRTYAGSKKETQFFYCFSCALHRTLVRPKT